MRLKFAIYAWLSAFALLPVCGINAANPSWFETDSAKAVNARLASDFSLSMPQAVKNIKALYPKVTNADIDRYIDKHYLEIQIINGKTAFLAPLMSTVPCKHAPPFIWNSNIFCYPFVFDVKANSSSRPALHG